MPSYAGQADGIILRLLQAKNEQFPAEFVLKGELRGQITMQ